MKTINNYMTKQVRDNGTEFWTTDNETLRDYIRSFHGELFPIDEIFSLVAEVIEEALKSTDRDDAEQSEGIYPIYNSEIHSMYGKFNGYMEASFQDWSEYMFLDFKGEEGFSPLSYETKALYAYLTWIKSTVLSFLEEDCAWSSEEATGLQGEA